MKILISKYILRVENGQVVKKGDILKLYDVPTLEEMVGTMQAQNCFCPYGKKGTSKEEQEMAPAILLKKSLNSSRILYRNSKRGYTSYGNDWARGRGEEFDGLYIGPEYIHLEEIPGCSLIW